MSRLVVATGSCWRAGSSKVRFALIAAFCLLLVPAWGEAAITDTTRKAENTAGGAGSVTVTLNSTVAGNLVVVGCSLYNSNSSIAPSLGITDGGNTYTQVFKASRSVSFERQVATLWYSVLGTGGNRTIVIDANDAENYDWWCNAHEFAGADATPVSGTAVTNSGTSETTSDTTAFTPADADALYVAVDGHSASGTVTENVSPGDTDWTLSNENESGASAEPGSMVFFIRSGGAVARRSAWTIPSGTFWAAGIGAFKPFINPTGRLVTEAGDCLIAENSDRFILEAGAGAGGTCEGGGGGAVPNNMRLLMGVGS